MDIGWLWLRSAIVVSRGNGRLAPGPDGRARCMSTYRAGHSHHVSVCLGHVVEYVRGQQYDRGLAGVLPPVLYPALLDRDLTGLVDDRHGAVAGVFLDRARDDGDQGRTVLMAVPRNDPPGLDDQLPGSQQVIL